MSTAAGLLNLTLADIAKISLQIALVIAVIVLWGAYQGMQADYRLLATTCAPIVVSTEIPQ